MKTQNGWWLAGCLGLGLAMLPVRAAETAVTATAEATAGDAKADDAKASATESATAEKGAAELRLGRHGRDGRGGSGKFSREDREKLRQEWAQKWEAKYAEALTTERDAAAKFAPTLNGDAAALRKYWNERLAENPWSGKAVFTALKDELAKTKQTALLDQLKDAYIDYWEKAPERLAAQAQKARAEKREAFEKLTPEERAAKKQEWKRGGKKGGHCATPASACHSGTATPPDSEDNE
ncbi:hypothetical protein FACS1894139_16630 [Planctomycetales bacterium]|nr:hypothetical protein FACS1894107_04850 [Planctomycetales bacterium]GHT07803.1 hypothetical protein FACS1894139_16630 [Planctomycetales bacterium]